MKVLNNLQKKIIIISNWQFSEAPMKKLLPTKIHYQWSANQNTLSVITDFC
jgi:thymidylate synthase